MVSMQKLNYIRVGDSWKPGSAELQALQVCQN